MIVRPPSCGGLHRRGRG